MTPPRVQFALRRWLAVVALLSVLFSYAESYYRLSRRGIREAAAYGYPGFLYIPFAEAAEKEDLTRHHVLATWYTPLNWLDQAIFGAPGPTDCIMWRLSG